MHTNTWSFQINTCCANHKTLSRRNRMKYMSFLWFFLCWTEWMYRQNEMKTSSTKWRKHRRWICRDFWNTLNAELCPIQICKYYFSSLLFQSRFLFHFEWKLSRQMLFGTDVRESSLEYHVHKKTNSFRYFTCGRLQHKTNTHNNDICNESLAILHMCTCRTVRWDGAAANVLRMRMNGHTQRHSNYRLRLGDSIFFIVLYDRLMFRVGTSLFCQIFYFFSLCDPRNLQFAVSTHSITVNVVCEAYAKIRTTNYYFCFDFEKKGLLLSARLSSFMAGWHLQCRCRRRLVRVVRFEVLYSFIIYCFIGFEFKFAKHSFVSSERFSCGCKWIAIGTKARTYVSMLWMNKCTIVIRWRRCYVGFDCGERWVWLGAMPNIFYCNKWRGKKEKYLVNENKHSELIEKR